MERNLLIVDDELEIVGWLEELFRYDFDREVDVYTARSGKAALELLNQIKFDVVLTDIHMPQMDGITLFQKIKENWPRCKTVFLTGYQNFDDVYKVFQHRDVRYVLKSERDETIMKAVSDAFSDIEREMEEERLRQIQNEKLIHADIWLKRSFLQDALTGRMTAGQMEAAAKELSLPIDPDREFLLFLLRMDDDAESGWKEGYPHPAEYLTTVLLENLPDHVSACVHVQENRHFYLFLQPEAERSESDDNRISVPGEIWISGQGASRINGQEASGMSGPGASRINGQGASRINEPGAGRINAPETSGKPDWARLKTVGLGTVEDSQEMFRRTYGITFSTVVRTAPVSFSGLSDAAAHMKQVMVGYVGKNQGMVIQDTLVEPAEERAQGQNMITQVPLLKSLLELGKQKEYFDLLDECTCAVKGRSTHDVYAIEIYYSIATMILQFINETDIYRQMAFKIGLYKLMKVDEHGNWTEAVQFLFEVSAAIFDLLGDRENTLTERALSRVIRYIEEHLSEDLPLKTLAEVGGFNASYLSRLFSQTCNQTITEYVCNKRMEKAKKLLAETDEKILTVSAETGYISSQSFARAFRNYTGLSPAEYREVSRGKREG